MYVPKKLKLNKFRIVQIPSAKEIITRFGYSPGSNYSGDNTVPKNLSKTDLAAEVDGANNYMSKQEQINSDYENNKDQL